MPINAKTAPLDNAIIHPNLETRIGISGVEITPPRLPPVFKIPPAAWARFLETKFILDQ